MRIPSLDERMDISFYELWDDQRRSILDDTPRRAFTSEENHAGNQRARITVQSGPNVNQRKLTSKGSLMSAQNKYFSTDLLRSTGHLTAALKEISDSDRLAKTAIPLIYLMQSKKMHCDITALQ